MSETVYLVKFDRGYYATKQPNYQWSYTDNPHLAKIYKTRKKAEERGEWGLSKITDNDLRYEIEQYTVKTIMELYNENRPNQDK